MASVVSLKDALIGWRASDCDAPIQLLRNKHGEYHAIAYVRSVANVM